MIVINARARMHSDGTQRRLSSSMLWNVVHAFHEWH